MGMKVLVATDGSEHSMKAVRRALVLAETEGADITLMSVAYFAKEDMDEMPPNIQDKLETQAVAALNKAKAIFDEKGIKVQTVLEAEWFPPTISFGRRKKASSTGFCWGARERPASCGRSWAAQPRRWSPVPRAVSM